MAANERVCLCRTEALDGELAASASAAYAVEKTAFASGRAAVALPVRQTERAIAAIAIEGPVVDLNDLSRDNKSLGGELSRWLDIVHTIEALARARPALFENPFDHIEADTIDLRWLQ